MATYQGDFKSILGGVSQQDYTQRQIGQVETQDNMTSDNVRGLRKRPGTRLMSSNAIEGVYFTASSFGRYRGYETDLGGGLCQFLVNTVTGALFCITETGAVKGIGQASYLASADTSNICFTTVGSSLYIANSGQRPGFIAKTQPADPALRGFAFILAGAYGREFKVIVTTSTGSYSASYTTPDGSATGDSAKATPEYIAGQIKTQLDAQVGGATGLSLVAQDGAYLYLEIASGHGSLNVSTSNGNSYVIGSNTHTVDLTTKLPAYLPTNANGFVMTVGDASFAQYFRYSASETRWIETTVYGSRGGLSNMPRKVVYDLSTDSYSLTTANWPGRDAGDDTTNSDPEFTDPGGYGITGLASFQGRLVIFSGPYICMGSSRRDDRENFYRTTVTQELDADRIEFTSTSFAGAVFRYGIPFNTDLILASEAHQGVIPGRTTILTPTNATAILTSTYQMDTGVSPQPSGRSLYYAYPRSNSSYSVKEMLPSGYTDAQYVSQDVTDHLPTYMEGACSYITSSTTNNIVVMGSTTEESVLYVNEYLWSGDDKVASSWHRWTLPGIVHSAWFVREQLLLLIELAGNFTVMNLSLRDSPDFSDVSRFLPAADMQLGMAVTNTNTSAPYIQFSTSGINQMALWDTIVAVGIDKVAATVNDGEFLGAEIGIKSLDTVNHRIMLQPSYGNASCMVGIRFTTRFSPTPPRVFNQDGTYLEVEKLVVQFYTIVVRNSSTFLIEATDRGGVSLDDVEGYVVAYTSEELGLHSNPSAERYSMRVRVGMEASSSKFTLVSTTSGDLNIQNMGYLIKFNNKVRRI